MLVENKLTMTPEQRSNAIAVEIAQRTPTVQNEDNRMIISILNEAVKKSIEGQSKKFITYPSNSTDAMVLEYHEFFNRLMEDSTLIDSCLFCDRAIDRSKALKSDVLSSCLETTLSKILQEYGASFRAKYETNRQKYIEGREDTSVKTLTFVAYAIYLNVVRNLLPGVTPHIPSYAITLAIVGTIVNHTTTPYATRNQMFGGMHSVLDRVSNNANVMILFNNAFRLTEKVVSVVNHRVNQFLGDDAQAPAIAPPNKKTPALPAPK